MGFTTVILMNSSSLIHSSYCYTSTRTKHSSDSHTPTSVATQVSLLLLPVISFKIRLISTTMNFTSGSGSHHYIHSLTTVMIIDRFLRCGTNLRKVMRYLRGHSDITHYLSFMEWRTTISQHPTMQPSHPLRVPLVDWHGTHISPILIYDTNTPNPTPRQYIARFRDHVRFQSNSTNTRHVLTPRMQYASDNDIMTILVTYDSPLRLTIDASFKATTTYHVYLLTSHNMQQQHIQ